jgi:hypothetical protein
LKGSVNVLLTIKLLATLSGFKTNLPVDDSDKIIRTVSGGRPPNDERDILEQRHYNQQAVNNASRILTTEKSIFQKASTHFTGTKNFGSAANLRRLCRYRNVGRGRD